jgi:hypothetical protein
LCLDKSEIMASYQNGLSSGRIRIWGEDPLLVERLRAPLAGALESRLQMYVVEVLAVGRVGEVLVSINGNEGRFPLLFQSNELEPAHVMQVVRDTVVRLGL